MDPLTHLLTGACIGRAGLNRTTAYATLTAVLAAEAPDLDVLWGFAGPVEALKHHRGITHAFIGAPVVAAVVVGAVWLARRWLMTRKRRQRGAPGHAPRQPVHWGWLYLTALLASYSHLLLDWTNNYGVRPFFPFDPRWVAGNFVFIVEPVLLGLPILALVIPGILGLTDREIGARRVQFRGRGWAIFALSGMAILWCWRWAEHAKAMAMAENTQIAAAPVTRILVEPYPINLFRWHAIVETDDYYQTAEIDTRTGSIESDPHRDVIYKPFQTTAVEAAKDTLLGHVYLDWGTWAVVRDLGQEPAPGMDPPKLPPSHQWTTVEFTDLRFAYSSRALGREPGRAPLGGWVYIVDNRDDYGESMNGRVQK